VYIFIYFYGGYPIHNDGSVEVNGRINNSYPTQTMTNGTYNSNGNMQNNYTDSDARINSGEEMNNQIIPRTERIASGQYLPNNDYAPPQDPDTYINSNYSQGIRGNYKGSSEIDAFFDQNNNVIKNAFMDKPIVTGVDETNGQYGAFYPQKTSCSAYNNQDCDPYDLYNADNYLPQQKIPSWFDPGADQVAVKDRNLVNVSRTMGINTTMGNKKNMSQDIRGGINNPRAIVGPWNQSVIEPGDDYHRLS